MLRFFILYCIYNILFPIIFILYFPFYLHKTKKRSQHQVNWKERVGILSREQQQKIKENGNNTVWIHAVSVGEVNIACEFIKAWQIKSPHLFFVLTCTTNTARLVLEKKQLYNTMICYNPIDIYICVAHFIHIIKPQKMIIFEVEIWPNLLYICNKKSIPLYLVNGRLSKRSSYRFKKYHYFFAPLFRLFNKMILQSDTDKTRLLHVNKTLESIHVVGNMKFDQKITIQNNDIPIKKYFCTHQDTIICLASTHAPEESLLLPIYLQLKESQHNLKLIIVPRHQERTKEIIALLKQHELTYQLLTDYLNSKKEEHATIEVLIGNTTGDLTKLMSLSHIVFMGKSLVPFNNDGGHNILEPALLHKPIIQGKYTENFQAITQQFIQQHAIMTISSAEQFKDAVETLITEAKETEKMVYNANMIIQQHQGAIEKTLKLIE